MPSITPGFAFITGVFGCFNHRILDPVHKPKTVTFDAEIPIGENDEGDLQCVKGIVHYFVPSHENSPQDDRKYFVSGKIISVGSEERAILNYDLQIEALTLFLLADVDDPPRAQVIIAGQTTERVTDHEFYFDITQYFMRQAACCASFDCHFPEGNPRFQKVGVPKARTQVIIVGFVTAASLPISTTSSVKKIPIEVAELQYLPSMSTSTAPSAAGPSSMFRKHVQESSIKPVPSSSAVNEELMTAPNDLQPPLQPSASTSNSETTFRIRLPPDRSDTLSDTDDQDHLKSSKRKKKS